MKIGLLLCCIFLTSSSIQSRSNSEIVVNGYDKDGQCTQESIEKALIILRQHNGGVLRLKKNGAYSIKPQKEHVFELPSHVYVKGRGATFVIEDGSNTQSFTWGAIFYADKKSDIVLEDINLDANGKNNPVLQKNGTYGWSCRNGLISALNTKDITIRNCKVTDVKGYGCIHLTYCDNVIIEGCEFTEIGVSRKNEYISDASVIMGVGNNWLIQNNVMRNSYLSDCGTGLDLACSYSTIKNNIVESFWAGANLANNGVTDCRGNTLELNDFVNNDTAIFLWATIAPYKGSCYDNIIKNNRIVWEPRNGWGARGIDMAFFVYGEVYNIVVKDNVFNAPVDKPLPPNSFEMAVNIGPVATTYSGKPNDYGKVRDVKIENNEIEGCTGPAIMVDMNSEDIIIKDNVLTKVSRGNVTYSVKSAFVVTNTTNDETKGPRKVLLSGNKVLSSDENCRQLIFVKKADVKVGKDNEFVK